MTQPPYTIDPNFMKRVDWAVNCGLSRNMPVILNVHHYYELFKDPNSHRERFLAIWQQMAEHYNVSIQRQLDNSTVLTVAYVGTQGHHIQRGEDLIWGNSALCQSLSGCGPGGEGGVYQQGGQTYYGTFTGLIGRALGAIFAQHEDFGIGDRLRNSLHFGHWSHHIVLACYKQRGTEDMRQLRDIAR